MPVSCNFLNEGFASNDQFGVIIRWRSLSEQLEGPFSQVLNRLRLAFFLPGLQTQAGKNLAGVIIHRKRSRVKPLVKKSPPGPA
jgi:hypothetical protein